MLLAITSLSGTLLGASRQSIVNPASPILPLGPGGGRDPLISPQSSYVFCSLRQSIPRIFPKCVQAMVYNPPLALQPAQRSPACTALEHRLPCFSTPCTRVLASVLEAGRPDLMVTGPPTNSSFLLVYFSSCWGRIQPSLNSVLDDTRVHRLHSSNIFCRRSSVEPYWQAFTLYHSSRFLRHFPFSYLPAPQSNFQCWITPAPLMLLFMKGCTKYTNSSDCVCPSFVCSGTAVLAYFSWHGQSLFCSSTVPPPPLFVRYNPSQEWTQIYS